MTLEPVEHEQLQGDIPALAVDRLHGDARARLVAHLASCDSCSRLLETAREIGATVRWTGGGLLAPHPEVDELRRYARGGAAGASEAIDAHAHFCASCALEVAAWRRSTGREAAATEHRPPSRLRASMAAAGTLAAGLLLGIWLGPWVLRDANEPSPVPTPPAPAQPTAPAAPWSGPVDVLRIEDSVRGTNEPAGIRVREGQLYVPLAVAIEPLEERASLGVLEIRIVKDDGGSAWSSSIDTAHVGELRGGILELTLLLPAVALPPGTYEATVRRTAAPDEPPLLQQRFHVRR